MNSDEYRNLKTGTADPLTPEQVLASALNWLEHFQKIKKKGRTDTDPRWTDATWEASIDGSIDAICCVLSVHLNEDGTIQPTHYYD